MEENRKKETDEIEKIVDGLIKLCTSELSVMILTELMQGQTEKRTYKAVFAALHEKDETLTYQEFLRELEELSDLDLVEIEKFEYMPWLKEGEQDQERVQK